MEKTKVFTKLDYRTMKYVNLFLIKYRRKAPIWFIATALIALGIAVYGLFAYKGNYFIPGAGLIFAIYSIYQMFAIEKRLDRSLETYFYNRRVPTQTVELTEEEIVVQRSITPEKAESYDWSYITEIFEMPQYYLLMAGKSIPVIIDRRPEALIEGTKEDLERILESKAALKPYKKIEYDLVKIPVTYVHQEFPPEDVKDVESKVEDVDTNKIIANDEVDEKDVREVLATDEAKPMDDKKEKN